MACAFCLILDRYKLTCTNTQIVTGLILSPVVNEFNFQGPFLKLGQNIGLLVGAVFWGTFIPGFLIAAIADCSFCCITGVGSDVWGRRSVKHLSHEHTSGDPPPQDILQHDASHYGRVCSRCGRLAELHCPQFACCCMVHRRRRQFACRLRCLSRSVTSTASKEQELIITPPEFVPASHQYLLTVLSVWWAFGQLLGSLVRFLDSYQVPH